MISQWLKSLTELDWFLLFGGLWIFCTVIFPGACILVTMILDKWRDREEDDDGSQPFA